MMLNHGTKYRYSARYRDTDGENLHYALPLPSCQERGDIESSQGGQVFHDDTAHARGTPIPSSVKSAKYVSILSLLLSVVALYNYQQLLPSIGSHDKSKRGGEVKQSSLQQLVVYVSRFKYATDGSLLSNVNADEKQTNEVHKNVGTSTTLVEDEVSCGQHSAPSCADCPQGVGADWCNGDCYWSAENGTCVSSECDFNDFVHRFKPDELDITCDTINELERGEIVGHGNVRKVHQAIWRGRRVAVKDMHDTENEYLNEVTQEASVLFQLRESKNVARMVGWCNSTIVLEYAPTTLNSLVFDKREEISVKRALSLGLDVVRGIAQLHSIIGGPVAHSDLKLEQYLVNTDGRLLLGDFNWMKYAGRRQFGKKCLFGQVRIHGEWSSPEEKLDKRLDEQIDIYSVALVLWSLMARARPYHHIIGLDTLCLDEDEHDCEARIIAGERPKLELMSEYPQDMQNLIVEAWDNDPSRRPTALDMVKRIEGIIQNYNGL